jgi:integrase
VVYLVAFYSMLRASNLLPESQSKADPRRQLVWGRIRKHDGGVVVRVVLAKNLQNGERVHEIALPQSRGSIFCPVTALHLLAVLRDGSHVNREDFCFLVNNSRVWSCLLKKPLMKLMKLQLARMGLDPKLYGFHSFRHGAIQAAARVQPSLELIRLQSGHASGAIHVYTAMPGASRMVTGARMLAELDNLPPAPSGVTSARRT